VRRLDEELGRKNLEKFRRLVAARNDNAVLPAPTLSAFLKYCSICYDSVGYDRIPRGASPRRKYKAMADGRDEGLLAVPARDPTAFAHWYRTRPQGGHPWEICRGGNSTHITLAVSLHEKNWRLWLEGFSLVRVVETARMAIALSERDVPFVLANAEEMLRMLSGEDFLGIVPEDRPLGYNASDFPPDAGVFSFACLRDLQEVAPSVLPRIEWYPVETLLPR
jgi:hypothetical protein